MAKLEIFCSEKSAPLAARYQVYKQSVQFVKFSELPIQKNYGLIKLHYCKDSFSLTALSDPMLKAHCEYYGENPMAITGGCLCGKIRYEINGPLFDVSHCHCSMCRRQHGAAFATYADFTPDSFNWVSGEDLVKIYETDSGDGWCFCNNCGSSLAGTDNGKITSIAVSTIVGGLGIKPQSHIFVGSKAPWYDIYDSLPQFEEWRSDDKKS